jgi:hypothetical protein
MTSSTEAPHGGRPDPQWPRLLLVLVMLLPLIVTGGCASVDDVQRASTLIRTDNELTRLLVEVRPEDRSSAAIWIAGLAVDAHARADALANTAHRADAIAFYRIAATADWRSGDPAVASDLFDVVETATDLCDALEAGAPERDCVYLRLVIPFASIEELFAAEGPLMALDGVQISTGGFGDSEARLLETAHGAIGKADATIARILEVGRDERLLGHPGMQNYYCRQLAAAAERHGALSSVVAGVVFRLQRHDPARMPGAICDTQETCAQASAALTARADRTAATVDGFDACR